MYALVRYEEQMGAYTTYKKQKQHDNYTAAYNEMDGVYISITMTEGNVRYTTMNREGGTIRRLEDSYSIYVFTLAYINATQRNKTTRNNC